MRSLTFFVVLLFASTSAFAVSNEWRSQMKELAITYKSILPYLIRGEPLPAEERDQKINQITHLISAVDGHFSDPNLGIDPSLKHVANLLQKNVALVQDSFKAGNYELGQRQLRSSFSYCIACHSTGQAPAIFQQDFSWPNNWGSEVWANKVELAAALGRFDLVTQLVRSELENNSSTVSSSALERAIRLTLAGTVRVTQNRQDTVALVEDVLKSPRTDGFLKESALTWAEDLQKLQSVPDVSKIGLLERGRRLIGAGVLDGTEAPPRRHEIIYLAVSQLMHQFLRTNFSSPEAPEADYLLGISYDGLRDIGLWGLHALYYEDCIRGASHSALAKKCFRLYERAALENAGRPHNDNPLLDFHLEEMRALAL